MSVAAVRRPRSSGRCAIAALVLAALVSMASCGGDFGGKAGKSAAPPQPAFPNPCALLQPKEVEAVVGNPVRSEQVFSEGSASLAGAEVCQYKAARQAAAEAPGTLPTDVTVELASAYPREVFLKYRAVNKGARPVAGVGTEAVWSETTNRVVVLQGDQVLAVSLRGDPSAPGYQDKAVRLASEALKGM